MMKKFVVALALCALLGFNAEAQVSDLQQIADALDVSTTKTFQFTANGTMYNLGRERQPRRAVAQVFRQELHTHLRFHRGSDARSSGAHDGRESDYRTRATD